MATEPTWQAQRDVTLRDLRSEHPWIPGATFIATPGLAEYLADILEDWYGWEPEPEFPGREHEVVIYVRGVDTTRECYCTKTRGRPHDEHEAPWIWKDGTRG